MLSSDSQSNQTTGKPPSTTLRRNVVDSCSVGDPPNSVEPCDDTDDEARDSVQTLRFVVYGFADRTEKRGERIKSPVLRAHGHEWSVRIYPRGDGHSPTDREWVSCYLSLVPPTPNPTTHNGGESALATATPHSRASVTATVAMRCRGVETPARRHTFDAQKRFAGLRQFRTRTDLLESALEDDGSTFVLEVDLRLVVPRASSQNRGVWYPRELVKEPFLVQLYRGGTDDTFDVVFKVEDSLFRAHKNVLAVKCPKLYKIARDCRAEQPLALQTVGAASFRALLDFCYTWKTPSLEHEGTTAELLGVAISMGCADLALYAESVLVDRFLRPSNAAALLLLADSHGCALLKEAAIGCVVSEPQAVRSTEAWEKIKASNRLLEEVLDTVLSSDQFVVTTVAHRGWNPPHGDDEPHSHHLDRWDVTSLRRALEKARLPLDGSRQQLVDRLRTWRQQRLLRQQEDQATEKR